MKHLWNAWLSKEGQNNVRAAGWETASAGTFYTHPGAVGFSALSAFSSSLLSKSFETAFCFLVPLGGDFVFTGTVNSSRWQISIHDQIELFLNSLKGKKNSSVFVCVRGSPYLPIRFSSSLGRRRGALLEGHANLPPIYERLEKDKRTNIVNKDHIERWRKCL